MLIPSPLALMARQEKPHVPGVTPVAGKVVSSILAMLTISVLALCLARRISATANWSKVPFSRWVTFAVYVDSIVFIIAATILEQGLGLNTNQQMCSASILLCLTCYLTTKALIFLFLIEKVYIIQKVYKPRFKSFLYCFNIFGMLLPYCAVIILNFIYRVAYFDDSGTCIIGMQVKSVMPLIIMDAGINFYLTMLFVIPLRSLYSYQSSPSSSLRTVTLRSFIGSCATLTSSVVNLTVLMTLHGEAAWICLMCCNADILFSVVVLHWVTSKDSSVSGTTPNYGSSHNAPHDTALSDFHTPKSRSKFDMESQFNGVVTTRITAAQKSEVGSGSDGEEDIGMGKLRIEVGQVVEREVTGGSSEASPHHFGGMRSHRSTEDLVYRT